LEYDVIGDVHGHAAALEALLDNLGYVERGGAYRHSSGGRMAVFVGDLVDRGPDQLRAVEIARRMRDAGSAAVVMGNHEHNAIGYATEDPDRNGHFLRIRGTKNKAQHKAFLDAVGEDSALHRELVSWMGTLPLWFETDGIRVVHACWHQGLIDQLSARSRDGVLDEATLVETFRKGSDLREAAEIVLKGLEADLPEGVSFLDKNGHRRFKSRLRWWDEQATTFAAAVVPEEGLDGLPEEELPPEARVPPVSGKPLFFGHYWMSGEPRILSHDRTCVDFSIAKDGVLCAYSWRGEETLDPANLTWVGQHAPAMAR